MKEFSVWYRYGGSTQEIKFLAESFEEARERVIVFKAAAMSRASTAIAMLRASYRLSKRANTFSSEGRGSLPTNPTIGLALARDALDGRNGAVGVAVALRRAGVPTEVELHLIQAPMGWPLPPQALRAARASSKRS